jgi:restriction system protein
MSLWLIRAGKHGEREQVAMDNNIAVIGWEKMPDMSGIKSREQLRHALEEKYPEASTNRIRNHESQIWPFLDTIKKGDLVVLPLKSRPAILLGTVEGDYKYQPKLVEGGIHTRPVKWLKEIPRSDFDQDLLYSFGAFMTVCKISRNDAESRVRVMISGAAARANKAVSEDSEVDGKADPIPRDIEIIAQDQIRLRISQRFKGHELTRLIKVLLEAQGNKVFMSPPGPDGGIDLLAGKGDLGFAEPLLAVQVKSGNEQVGTGELNQLGGVISKVGATHGLLVSWSGFKGSATRELASSYFKIRFWDSSDIIELIQQYYDRLPDEVRAEIPLRRIWTLVAEDEE